MNTALVKFSFGFILIIIYDSPGNIRIEQVEQIGRDHSGGRSSAFEAEQNFYDSFISSSL